MKENPTAPTQAQHSPLPWQRDLARRGMIRDVQDSIVAEGLHTYDAAFIVRACNNAQRLADALKNSIAAMNCALGVREAREALAPFDRKIEVTRDKAREALAEWSKQK